MSPYVLVHRLRVPAFLLLIGILALLHQTGVIDHFWHLFWPLAFILAGVIMLAERAAIGMGGGSPPPYPGPNYPDPNYPGAPYSGAPYPGAPAAPASTAMVPAHSHDLNDPQGGQS